MSLVIDSLEGFPQEVVFSREQPGGPLTSEEFESGPKVICDPNRQIVVEFELPDNTTIKFSNGKKTTGNSFSKPLSGSTLLVKWQLVSDEILNDVGISIVVKVYYADIPEISDSDSTSIILKKEEGN